MSTGKRIDPEATAESLHSAAIHLLRHLRRTDAAAALNSARLSALSVIVFSGPITLGHLAGLEQVRPPTMTRIVNALASKAFVTKSASTSDRRTIRISATIKGKRLLLQARRRRIRSLAQRIAILPPHERQKLQSTIGILDKLIRAL